MAGRDDTGCAGMRSGLWSRLFDDLADPAAVARLAGEAEEAGWDGVFVWDHLRRRAPVRQVADPWITLAAIAAATERVRLGPMVTPLPRRRAATAARETATLDLLSGGCLTLGVGLEELVYYGPDTASALNAMLTLQMTKAPLAQLDATRTRHALDRLSTALAAHDTGSGVYFDSRAWIITARRR